MKQLTNCLIIVLLMFASSAKADNLKVNTVLATPGTTVEIPVELVNTKVYSMFEMNVVLPNGFELMGVMKSERFKNGRLYDFSKQSDGSYQILTQSQEEVITGNSGTLLTLSVKVPTTAQGSYTGRIQNVLFTDMNITPAYFPDVSFTITVSTVQNTKITLPSAGYATFYSSESAYTLPSGLTARVVTSVSNGKLTYRTLTGSVVPKGVAVMLESSTKHAATYTLTPTTDSGSYTGTNLLRGSDEATTTMGDGYHYKLTYGPSTDSSLKDVFGWYWGSSNGGGFRIDGHKAWLVLPKSVGTRSFSVDGVANGISDMNVDATEGEYCYDLQGRRMSLPAKKGVYIINGKKRIIK